MFDVITAASDDASAPTTERDAFTEAFFAAVQPQSPTRGLDLAVFFCDHLLRLDHLALAGGVTVGADEGNTVVLDDPAIPASTFTLVAHRGDDLVLTLAEGMGGQLLASDGVYAFDGELELPRSRDLGAGRREIVLGRGMAARVDIGDAAILVRHAAVEAALGGRRLRPDLGLAIFAGVSLAVHVLFFAIAMFAPPQSQAFALDGFSARDRFISQLVTPQAPPEEEPEFLAGATRSDPDAEGANAAPEEAGAAGAPDARPADRARLQRGPRDNSRPDFQKDREIVAQRGVFVAMNDNTLARSWTQGDPIQGRDPITSLGNNRGPLAGDSLGNFALSRSMTQGPGGGGIPGQTYEVTDFSRTRRRPNGPNGPGPGGIDPDAELTEKGARTPDVIPQKPIVKGSLDREIIQGVIRKHRREIKYCYEQGLIQRRDLSGRVMLGFTIDGTGSVIAPRVLSSSLGDPQVERCITEKARRWVFPSPEGGLVVVSYPFRFAPDGQ